MKSSSIKIIFGGPLWLVTLALVGSFVAFSQMTMAQDQRDRIGIFRDWEAIVLNRSDGEIICYMISTPRDTNPKNVRRGEIYVTITHKPKMRVMNEVTIIVGYPFRAESEAVATIGNRRFSMFTEADSAWMFTSRQDQEIVQAMRDGSAMVVTGVSSRGTDTSDRYSLMGFTAANDAITNACQ